VKPQHKREKSKRKKSTRLESASKGSARRESKKVSPPLRMFLVPCSCGTTFAVAENYDHQGTAWGRYLVCPGCGKRHDPKNRLLQMGFHAEGYWKVDEC
jgi:hypothetical protein